MSGASNSGCFRVRRADGDGLALGRGDTLADGDGFADGFTDGLGLGDGEGRYMPELRLAMADGDMAAINEAGGDTKAPGLPALILPVYGENSHPAILGGDFLATASSFSGSIPKARAQSSATF